MTNNEYTKALEGINQCFAKHVEGLEPTPEKKGFFAKLKSWLK